MPSKMLCSCPLYVNDVFQIKKYFYETVKFIFCLL